jgi:hypothetical protein
MIAADWVGFPLPNGEREQTADAAPTCSLIVRQFATNPAAFATFAHFSISARI